jgi:hypothetical protein
VVVVVVLVVVAAAAELMKWLIISIFIFSLGGYKMTSTNRW